MRLPESFKPARLAAALVVSGIGATNALAYPAVVTNGDNDGEGSLRAALASGATEIVVTTNQDIMITDTLVYSDTRALAIYGSGQKIVAHDDFTLLEVSEGASLKVVGLDFKGPGGFSIQNQSDDPGNAGKGIFIDVRDDQTGNVRLEMVDVTVRGVANHGVHVSDCDLADDCGGGGGGAGGGSPASIRVIFNNVVIKDVGNGKFDADGLRVDERNSGNITFNAYDFKARDVGADGVELDEGQDGTVRANVYSSSFNENGNYCDPELLQPQLDAFLGGAPDEDEFDESEEVTEDDLPGPVTGTLDDRCFEYEVDLYDSDFVEAYEYGIDVDDGFDIDEAGKGSLVAVLVDSRIEENLDEGVDFDEEDQGRIDLIAIRSKAEENADDGFKLSEEGSAGVEVVAHKVRSTDNGGKGLVFEEADNGSLTALVSRSTTENNDDSDDTGIEAVQEDNGSGTLTVRNSSIADGIDAEGVTVIEE